MFFTFRAFTYISPDIIFFYHFCLNYCVACRAFSLGLYIHITEASLLFDRFYKLILGIVLECHTLIYLSTHVRNLDISHDR